MYRIPSNSGTINTKAIQSMIDTSINLNNTNYVDPTIDSKIQEVKDIVFNLINDSYYVNVYETDEPNVYKDLRGVHYRSDTSSNRTINEVRNRSSFTVFEYMKLPNGSIQHITSPVQYNLYEVNKIEYRTSVNPDYCCIYNRTPNVSIDCILTLDSHAYISTDQAIFDKDHVEFKNIVVNTTYDINKEVIKHSLCNHNKCNQITFNNCCNFSDPVRLFEHSYTRSIYVNNSEDITSKSGGFVSLNDNEFIETIHYNKLQDCSDFIVGQLDRLFMNTRVLSSVYNLEYNNTIIEYACFYNSNLLNIYSYRHTINRVTAIDAYNLYNYNDFGNINHMFNHDSRVYVSSFNFNKMSGFMMSDIDFILDNRLNTTVDSTFRELSNVTFDNITINTDSDTGGKIVDCVYDITGAELSIRSHVITCKHMHDCHINTTFMNAVIPSDYWGQYSTNTVFYFNFAREAQNLLNNCSNCKLISPVLNNCKGLFKNSTIKHSNEAFLSSYNIPNEADVIGFEDIDKWYILYSNPNKTSIERIFNTYSPETAVISFNMILCHFRQNDIQINPTDDSVIYCSYKTRYKGKSGYRWTNCYGTNCDSVEIVKNGMSIEFEGGFWIYSINCRIVP